jgi:hypothetical protein
MRRACILILAMLAIPPMTSGCLFNLAIEAARAIHEDEQRRAQAREAARTTAAWERQQANREAIRDAGTPALPAPSAPTPAMGADEGAP